MTIKNRANIEAHILKLLSEKAEISLQNVALTTGLSKSDEGDRKAIRRVLTSLGKRCHAPFSEKGKKVPCSNTAALRR